MGFLFDSEGRLTILERDPSIPHGAGKDVAYGLDHGGLHWLNSAGTSSSTLDTLLYTNMVSVSSLGPSQSMVSFDLAHRRACHASHDRVQQIDYTTLEMTVVHFGVPNVSCDACFGGRHQSSP